MSDVEIEDKKFFKKIDPSGVIIIILFLSLIAYVFVRTKGITKEAVYTKGVIINTDTGVHGHLRLNYYFFVNGERFKNSVTARFCNECDSPCCHTGDSVIVRYQRSNPNNNDLLHQLPNGATLTY